MSSNTDFPMIRRAKTAVAGNLGVDFASRHVEDYIVVLNNAAKAIGAVPNMGIYAEIGTITPYPMLKVETTAHYIRTAIGRAETPRKTKSNKHNLTSLEQMSLDALVHSASDTVTGILDGTIQNHQCDPYVRCNDCNGTGKCRRCNGEKHLECNMCEGSGDCHNCHGDGIVECNHCNGLGDCPTCNGTGLSGTSCPACGGNGKLYDEATKRKTTCPNCGGRGVMPCPECTGNGYKPGKCTQCKGKGEVQCHLCNGSGKCSYCKGKGHHTCDTCKGTGKCDKCNGSGKLKCTRCDGSGWYQTYFTYTATHVTESYSWASNADYAKELRQAQGLSVFSGRLKKWQKANIQEYDHTVRLRSSVAAASGGDTRSADRFIAEHEEVIGKPKGIRYASDAEATLVPAVRIDFVLEQVPHSMVILGHNGVVVYDSLPSKLEQYRVGFFNRIKMSFNRSRRHMEYIRLAAYIFQTDGRALEESRLLNAFVRQLGYRPAKTKQLIKSLDVYDNDMDYNELREEIKHLLSSRRVLTFAWQCMERDGRVSDREQQLWQQLTAEFDVSESELQQLKRNASRYALLNDEEIVEEYLRK